MTDFSVHHIGAMADTAGTFILREAKSHEEAIATAALVLVMICETLGLEPDAAHAAIDAWGDQQGMVMQ